MRKIILIVLLSFYIFLGKTLACSCGIMSADTEANNSDLVFIGIVSSNYEIPEYATYSQTTFGKKQITSFTNIEYIKGSGESSLRAISNYGSSCGEIVFQSGSKYIVYANYDDNVLYASSACSHTRLILDKELDDYFAYNDFYIYIGFCILVIGFTFRYTLYKK